MDKDNIQKSLMINQVTPYLLAVFLGLGIVSNSIGLYRHIRKHEGEKGCGCGKSKENEEQ